MTHCENTRESRLNIPSSTSLLPKSVTFRTLEACCYRNVFDVNEKISLLQTPVSRIMKLEGTQRVAKHVCVSLTPPSRVFRPWINPGTRPEVAVPHLVCVSRSFFFVARQGALRAPLSSCNDTRTGPRRYEMFSWDRVGPVGSGRAVRPSSGRRRAGVIRRGHVISRTAKSKFALPKRISPPFGMRPTKPPRGGSRQLFAASDSRGWFSTRRAFPIRSNRGLTRARNAAATRFS